MTIPFYLAILLFTIFVMIMSVVYVYHWTNFSMGDKFIKRFVFVYLLGLIVLGIPLLTILLTS